MNKYFFLFLATVLLTSCQDDFLNDYKEGVNLAWKAYDEIDNLHSSASDYCGAKYLDPTDEYLKKKNLIKNYEDDKHRYNTLLVEMDKYQTKFMVSSINNEKKKEAYELYCELHDETKKLIRQACWIAENIDKDDSKAFLRQKDIVQELHEQIERKYIQKINAGKNPFK